MRTANRLNEWTPNGERYFVMKTNQIIMIQITLILSECVQPQPDIDRSR
ncbi:hypothetical protein MHI18_08465 [Peribacillus sp. FSL H8-0477]